MLTWVWGVRGVGHFSRACRCEWDRGAGYRIRSRDRSFGRRGRSLHDEKAYKDVDRFCFISSSRERGASDLI